MENATRALTMAGGILIALMILGALFLMFNNLSSYQNQNDASTKDTQIESNNKKNPEYKIDIDITFNGNHEGDLNSNFQNNNFSAISESEKTNSKFKCVQLKRKGVDGRINYIKFEDTTETIKASGN